MSYWICVGLAVFDRRDPNARQRLGEVNPENVPGLLNQSDLPGDAPLRGKRKYLEATARNGHFQYDCKQLFDAMGTVDSLRFFSEELYTYSKFHNMDVGNEPRNITADELEQFGGQIKNWKFGGGYSHYYVFDKTQYQRIIADIDRLLIWSVQNAAQVARVFYGPGQNPGEVFKIFPGKTPEQTEKDLIDKIESAPVCDNPAANESRGDDGMGVEVGFDASGPAFTYRMLKTSRYLLDYANTNGMEAVYISQWDNADVRDWLTLVGKTI
jgi:hypothetical protein